MASDEIWVSNVFNDTTIIRGTDINRSEPGWGAVRERRPVPEADLPLRLYPEARDDTFKKMPPLFYGGGGMKISRPIADVLQKFDLGQASLASAQLYLFDRTTPVEGQYLIYLPYELKEAFSPEQSRDVRTNPYDTTDPPPYWNMPRKPKDDDIAVHKHALGGADMWMDKKLYGSLFMTGPLVEALQKAGFAKYFSLTRCRVIRPH